MCAVTHLCWRHLVQLLVSQTDLKRLCSVWLHDSPHVQDKLTNVFPNLTPMKHEGVGDSSVGLFGHMVGCCSGFLLVLGLKGTTCYLSRRRKKRFCFALRWKLEKGTHPKRVKTLFSHAALLTLSFTTHSTPTAVKRDVHHLNRKLIKTASWIIVLLHQA